jgi:hypothetical protein
MKQLKNNLIKMGNKIYSYETHVATIVGSELLWVKKYSATTWRHLRFVENEFNLTLKQVTNI